MLSTRSDDLAGFTIDEVKAKRCDAPSELAEGAGPLLGVVTVGTEISIDEVAFQRAIDEDGKLAGGGGDGLGLPDSGREAPIEGSEHRLRPAEAHRGHSENPGGAIGGRLR